MKRSQFKNRGKGIKRRRISPEELEFNRLVRERDENRCQWPKGCQTGDDRIDVHHVAKRSQRPDLKLEISNGLCLCRTHHERTNTHHDEAVELGMLSIESYELASKQ